MGILENSRVILLLWMRCWKAESDLLNPNGSLKVQPENWKNPKNGTQATNHLGFVLMGIRDLFRQLMGHSWRPGEEYKPL